MRRFMKMRESGDTAAMRQFMRNRNSQQGGVRDSSSRGRRQPGQGVPAQVDKLN
jgi:hypothetical protein